VWRAFLALSAGALFSASFPVHFLEFLTYKFMLQPPKNSRGNKKKRKTKTRTWKTRRQLTEKCNGSPEAAGGPL